MIDAMTSPGGRISRLDKAIAVVACALGLVLIYSNHTDPSVKVSLWAAPLFMGVTLPLLWRRVAPIGAAVVAVAALLLHLAIFGTSVVRCGVVLPESFLFAFAAGSRLELRQARFGLLAAVSLIAVESSYFIGTFGLVVAAVAAGAWGIGRVVRSRNAMVDDLEQRTEELREARDKRASLEVKADRARLSSELDELLQRRLRELAQLAGDGGPADAATATATLAEIESQSRATLEEMRSVVGVLRADDPAPTSPQPTLLNLEALLVRAKGADARLTVEGSPRVLPAGVELSAYRIAEHLLDALDDAPDVDVRVRFADDAIELAVSGPANRGAKAAFEQARERARLQHGTLEATTRGGHAEAVASLPVLATV